MLVLEVIKGDQPEIIETKAPNLENSECVAAPRLGGILDTTSRKYKKIEIEDGVRVIKERAVYRASEVELNVSAGGCHHAWVGYNFIFTDETAIGNKEYYLQRALELLKEVDLKSDSSPTFVKDIFQAVEKSEKDSKSLELCRFEVISGYSAAFCGFERVDAKKVKLTIGFDIAL